MVASIPKMILRATGTNLVANALQSGRSSKLALKGVWHMVDSNVHRAMMRGDLPNTKHYKRGEFLRWAVTRWPKIQAQFPDIEPLPNVTKCNVSVQPTARVEVALVTIPADHEVLRQRHEALQLIHQEVESQLKRIIAEQATKVLAYDKQQNGNVTRRRKNKVHPAVA